MTRRPVEDSRRTTLAARVASASDTLLRPAGLLMLLNFMTIETLHLGVVLPRGVAGRHDRRAAPSSPRRRSRG
jgi:hypothetical protein